MSELKTYTRRQVDELINTLQKEITNFRDKENCLFDKDSSATRYRLTCTSIVSIRNVADIQEKYPSINKYHPKIEYPFPNKDISSVSISVVDFQQFIDDIRADDTSDNIIEVIISKDDYGYCIEIYDDYRE